MARETRGVCALCGREGPTTFHHLIPRTVHSNKWFKKRFTREQMAQGVDLCRPCHSAVHAFADHKTLGCDFSTLEALTAHPELRRFVAWVREQDSMRVKTLR